MQTTESREEDLTEKDLLYLEQRINQALGYLDGHEYFDDIEKKADEVYQHLTNASKVLQEIETIKERRAFNQEE